MPERELQITLKFAKQAAERMAQEFHANERRRIKETSGEQDKSDRAFVRAMKMRLRAQADLAREYEKTVKSYEKSDGRYMETYRRNARLREAVFRKEMAVARADIDGLTRHYEKHSARVRQFHALEANARKNARNQARREEKLEDERDLESFRQMARQRLEAHAKGARDEAENVRVALKTAEIYRRQADEADKEGRKGRAAGYRALAEGQVRNAEFAAEESTRHAKMAAQEQGVVTRGQGETFKRLYKGIVTGAQDAAKGATQAIERGTASVNTAAKKSGDVQRSEAKKTTSVIEEQQKTILSVSTAYTTMRIGAEVSQAIHAAMQAVADSTREARDHVAGMVRNTEQLRDAMAEVLALQGKPISSAATAEELTGFAKLGLNPQQGIAAQKSFRQEAQGMIGAGKDYRMTPEQAKELSGFAAKIAANQGMEVGSAELLMSTIISKADVDRQTGKVDDNQVKEQFARNMNLFRNERGSTAQDVRQAAEAIQKNARNAADVDELAVLHAAQSQIGPGKSRVHLDALFRAFDQLDDNKREQLGIKPGMTDQQKLAAATAAIPRIAKAEFGGDERMAARNMGFNNQQELDAFMAHLNEGVRGNLYEKVRAEQRAGSAAKSEAEHAAFMKSEGGVAGRQASEDAAVEAKRTAFFRNLTEARKQAAILVKSKGQMEVPEGAVEAIGTRIGGQYGQGNRFEQETDRQQLGELKAGLEQFAGGRNWLRQHPEAINPITGVLDPRMGEQLMGEAHNRLRELQRDGDSPLDTAREKRLSQGGDGDVGQAVGRMFRENYKPAVRFPDRMNVAIPPGIGELYGKSNIGGVFAAGRDAMGGDRVSRRGRRIVLPGADGRLNRPPAPPGADGRISRRFRHGYVGDAPNSVVSPVRRRAQGPGNPADLGRIGAGVAYSAGMFAADPAHVMARLQIRGNHNFLGQYQERQEATMADMAARRAGMAQRRLAADPAMVGGGVMTMIPPAMPSKPHVMRN